MIIDALLFIFWFRYISVKKRNINAFSYTAHNSNSIVSYSNWSMINFQVISFFVYIIFKSIFSWYKFKSNMHSLHIGQCSIGKCCNHVLILFCLLFFGTIEIFKILQIVFCIHFSPPFCFKIPFQPRKLCSRSSSRDL